MTSLAHRQIHAPELNIGRRKPIGPVRSRVNGPHIAILFNRGWYSIDGNWGPTNVDDPVDTTAGNVDFGTASLSYLDYGRDFPPINADEFTIITKARGVGNTSVSASMMGSFGGSNQREIGIGPASSGAGTIFYVGYASNSFLSRSGATNEYSADYFTTNAYRFSLSTGATDGYFGYMRGKDGSKSEQTHNQTSRWKTGTYGWKFGSRGDAGSYWFKGDIEFFFWWPYNLSDDQTWLALQDPYGFCLEPAAPLFFGPTSATNVTTNDGLLTSTSSLEGNSQLSVSTADGLLTATSSLEGTVQISVSVTTNDGLLTTTSSLLGDSQTSVVTNDGLLSTLTSLLGDVQTHISVTTNDGLLTTTTDLQGDHVISVTVPAALLEVLSSVEGSSQVGIVTNDGLLSVTSSMLGDAAHVDVTVPDALLEVNPSLEGSHTISVSTVDGLLQAVTSLIGSVTVDNPGLGTVDKPKIISTSHSWRVTVRVSSS